MTELEVLRAARRRIECEEDWVSKSAMGGPWCLGLAVECCDQEAHGHHPFPPPMVRLAAEIGGCSPGAVYDFNDTHSHAEVLALLDTVIAKLEEQSYGAGLPPLPVTTKEKVMA